MQLLLLLLSLRLSPQYRFISFCHLIRAHVYSLSFIVFIRYFCMAKVFVCTMTTYVYGWTLNRFLRNSLSRNSNIDNVNLFRHHIRNYTTFSHFCLATCRVACAKLTMSQNLSISICFHFSLDVFFIIRPAPSPSLPDHLIHLLLSWCIQFYFYYCFKLLFADTERMRMCALSPSMRDKSLLLLFVRFLNILYDHIYSVR